MEGAFKMKVRKFVIFPIIIFITIITLLSITTLHQPKKSTINIKDFNELIIKAYNLDDESKVRELIRDNRLLLDQQIRKNLDESVRLFIKGRPDSAKAIEDMEESFAQIFYRLFNDKRPLKVVEMYRSWNDNQKIERIKADSLQNLSSKLMNQSEHEKAIQLGNQAKAIYLSLADLKSATDQISNVALIFDKKGEFKAALEMHREALNNRKKIGDIRGEGASWTNMGTLYSKLGELEKAEKCHSKALEIFNQLNDYKTKADVLYNIGTEYTAKGDSQKGLKYMEQSIAVYRDLNLEKDIADTEHMMGLMYVRIGEIEKGRELLERSLLVFKKIGDQYNEGINLLNLSIAYSALGNTAKRIELLQNSLEIARKVGHRILEAYDLEQIGIIYAEANMLDRALLYFNESLALSEELGIKRNLLHTRTQIANLYADRGDIDKAILYAFETLQLIRDTAFRQVEATQLKTIGEFYILKSDWKNARKYTLQSLETIRQIEDQNAESEVLASLAIVYKNLDSLETAKDYAEKAIAIAETRKIMPHLWYAQYSLGLVQDKLNQEQKALTSYLTSIHTLEGIRDQISLDDFKSGFISKHIDVYDLAIDQFHKIYSKTNNVEYQQKSFDYSERAKARTLLEILSEANAKIKQHIEPNLFKQMEQLNREITSLLSELQKMESKVPEYQKIHRSLEVKETRLNKLKQKIRSDNPAFADLRYPLPVTVQQVQLEILSKDMILLEYFLGKENSYLWVITTDSVSMFQLPDQETIEGKLNSYLELISRPPAIRDFLSPGHELYSLLMPFEPGKLKPKSHLLIIPDGILHHLPFETLVIEKPIGTEVEPGYLISKFEISYAPSASIALFLKKHFKTHKWPMELLALANPILGPKDSLTQCLDESLNLVTPSFAKEIYRDIKLHPLEYSRSEVDKISSLYSSNKQKLLFGDDAREEEIKSENLTRYKKLHFSTHGILDEQFPARSAIVLTLDDDPVEDGFLQMHEIFNLNINADLVVLSACQTGLGRLMKGEGVIGISRAFFYAGASSILVSLWNVEDKSTAQLMVNFYQNLESGMSKSKAIQKAKLQFISQNGRESHPFFWAPFVLSGNH